jgi:GT2 family glycosyltransferase
MAKPDLSIVIVNWNTRDLLLRCIETAHAVRGELQLEFVVIDNASSDDSVACLRERFPDITLIENTKNVGFARANNQGVRASHAPLSLLLNSDAFLTVGSLQALMDVVAAHPKAALVGAQLRNADGTFQASHTAFPTLWREFLILSGLGRVVHGHWFPSHGPDDDRGAQPTDYVEGACMLVQNAAYLSVGGLDEGFFMYAEEVDLCYRLQQAGWQVWYQPAARVTHLGGGSSKNRKVQREVDLYRSRVQFFRKHHGGLAGLILKGQIIGFTALKSILHALLRVLTQGRRGRRVAPLRDLYVI